MTNSNEPQTFRDFSQKWLTHRKPQIKESTFNKYHNLLKNEILPAIGERTPVEITCTELEIFCTRLLSEGGKGKRGLSPKTVSDTLSVIRQVLRFAATHSGVHLCDTSAVQVRQSSREMRVLSRGEQEKLYRYLCANKNGQNIGILVCLFTGLRVGEICALRWEDISIEERTLHVRQTLQRVQNLSGSGAKTRVLLTTPKSSCSIRTIPIPDELVQRIPLPKHSPRGYFLTNSNDKYIEPRVMQKYFRKVLKNCGVAPANFHALRHTFATRCVELGMDSKSLSEILGHSNVTITMSRYVHPSMELKRESMNRLSALFPHE